MKKNKAFTLIELLAIIVILAIIAVITVPIILNIIENSKMGAATDSAYGYKDSINKWYLEKLSTDTSYNLGTTYEIQSDATLKNAESASDVLTVNISGQKPTGGWVVLSSSTHTIDNACMIIGDYMVKFNNGNINETVKGSDCGAIPGGYEPSPESWFTYETSNDVITITGLTNEAKSLEPEEIVIPKTIGGKTVVAIGDNSFGNMYGSTDYVYIKKIIIPNTIKKVGYFSFGYMQTLEEIKFNEGCGIEEIGDDAFYGLSNLKKFEIDSENIKKLGFDAFYGTNINEFVIGSDLDYTNGGLDGAKINKLTINMDEFVCHKTGRCEQVEIGTLEYGENVKVIPENAFNPSGNGLKIENLKLNDGLTTIGSKAFDGVTGLISVTIPSSVTSLAEDAFPSSVTIVRNNQ